MGKFAIATTVCMCVVVFFLIDTRNRLIETMKVLNETREALIETREALVDNRYVKPKGYHLIFIEDGMTVVPNQFGQLTLIDERKQPKK